MSYQIITRITITSDLRVMVRMAANNIRPLDFRYDEVVSLTETLRTKGRPTLELELLSLFFKGLWQGRTRYDRAVSYALLTDGIDKYEAWERCREDKEYERGLLLRMRGFLHYGPFRAAATSNIKEALCDVFMSGYISFSRQRRRIFPSVLDAQACAVRKGLGTRQVQIRRRRNEP